MPSTLVSPAGRRIVGTAVAALMALGTSPFIGVASAVTGAPVLKSADPAGGSRISTVGTAQTVAEATFDIPLSPASTFTLKDGYGHAVAGTTALSPSDPTTITFTAVSAIAGKPALGQGLWNVTVIAVNAVDGAQKSTNAYSFTVDNTAPVGTTVQVANVTAANVKTVAVTGAGEPGSTIALSADDSDDTNNTSTSVDPAKTPVSRTATVGANGLYTAAMDLSNLVDGAFKLTARATDEAGNDEVESASATGSKDTLAPAVPTVGALGAVNTGNAAAFDVTGTREAASRVVVTAEDSAKKTVTGESTPHDSTSWIATLDLGPLADGELAVTAVAYDAAGNASATSAKVLTSKDVLGPNAPAIDDVVGVNAKNAGALPLSGTRDANTSVTLLVTDSTTGAPKTVHQTLPAADSGTWSTELDVRELLDGTLTVTATATDAAGNASSSSAAKTTLKDVLAPAAPTTDPLVSINAARAAAYDVTGGAEPATTVSVSVDDSGTAGSLTKPVTGTATADATGLFSVEDLALSSLEDGELTFTVTATDAAGNVSTAVAPTSLKDTKAPAAPAIGSATDPVTTASAAIVSGTSEKGTVVTVTATDGHDTTPATVAADTPASSDTGAYSTTLDLTSLADGAFTYQAVATDAAGNTSAATSKTAVRNVTALAFEHSTPEDGAGVGSAPEITLTFTEPIDLDSASLTVTNVGGTSLAGTRTLRDNGRTLVFTPPSALADAGSPYTVTYSVLEARAPEQQSVSGEFSFFQDATRQNAPTGIALTNPVTAANAGTAAVTGTAERPGSVISVRVDDADAATAAVTGTGTSSATDGTFTIPVDLSTLRDGILTASVTATENGVTSSRSKATATKDATAPSGTTVRLTDPITQANQAAVVVSGTAEPGSTISARLLGGAPAVTTSATDGTYKVVFDATALPNGTVTAEVVASDPLGNAAAPVQDSSTKDAGGPPISGLTAPTTVTSANQDKVVVSGKTDADVPVQVTITGGSSVVGSAQSSLLEGTFSITLDVSTLANDQDLTVTAITTDSLGNTERAETTTYKDSVGPSATTLAMPTVNSGNATSVDLTGTGEPGQVVTVTISDNEAATDLPKTADITGTTTVASCGEGKAVCPFTIDKLDLSSLRDGRLEVAAAVKDSYGNAGTPVLLQGTKDVTAPVITAVSVPAWVNRGNQAATTVSGTTTGDTTGVVVSATDGAKTVEKTVSAGSGAFSTELDLTGLSDTAAADGLVTKVTALDANGNQESMSATSGKDTVAPAIEGLAATDTNPTEPSSTVSGTTEPGSTVGVVVSDGFGSSSGQSDGPTTASAFSVVVDTADLADGPLDVIAVATDRAGNAGAPAATTSTKTDPDVDGDGVESGVDNCPGTANEDQADLDGDKLGDVCDDVADVHNGSFVYSYVRALIDAQVTAGCSAPGEPLRFCPDSNVSRGQMAIFLARSNLGRAAADELPAYEGGFSDVSSGDYYSRSVRYLKDNQITGGCGDGNYCPGSPVIRGDMSLFLARTSLTRDGADALPAYNGEFSDVTSSDYYATSVKWAKDAGVTSGCGDTRFCPGSSMTRGQMAIFLVRTFDLPLPG